MAFQWFASWKLSQKIQKDDFPQRITVGGLAQVRLGKSTQLPCGGAKLQAEFCHTGLLKPDL